MSLRKYLTSRVFLFTILIAIAIIGFGVFVYALADVYNGSWSRNCVPNLSKLTEEQVGKLDEMDLDYAFG
jgi:hypothetical protein